MVTNKVLSDIEETFNELYLETTSTNFKKYLKKGAKPKVLFNCSYFPLSLFPEERFRLIRIPLLNAKKSTSLIQGYVCSVVRGMAEAVIETEDEPVIVITDSCDSMKMLGEVLMYGTKGKKIISFSPPTVLKGEKSRKYLTSEIYELKRKIEQTTGLNLKDEELNNEMENIIHFAEKMYELEDSFFGLFPLISNKLMFYIRFFSFYLPRKKTLQYINDILNEASKKDITSGIEAANFPTVIINGSFIDDPLIYEIFDRKGIRVIDDTCLFRRHYFTPPVTPDSWVEYAASRLFYKRTCPCFHRESNQRIEELKLLIESFNAAGVIFYFQKFCDPHYADYPVLRKTAEEMGVKTLKLEFFKESKNPEKLENIIDSFLEILEI